MEPLITVSNMARILGVSESTVRRWCDGGQLQTTRTIGGHRKIPRQDAIRFIHRGKLHVLRPDLLTGMSASKGDTPSAADDIELFYLAAEAGRTDAALSLIDACYLGGKSVAEICDGPLRESMHRIGARWPEDERAIFLEHRATNLCIRILDQLRSNLPVRTPGTPVALGGAPTDDPFLLPSWMVATVLADVGFADINLGPNTPIDVIEASAMENDARIVWLSLTASRLPRALEPELTALADRLAERDAHLVIGGQAARGFRFNSAPHLHTFDSMQELSGFARGLLVSGRQTQIAADQRSKTNGKARRGGKK